MNFNSGVFLIFLPVVLAGYWLLPHRLRKFWLLAASWFFYMYANPALILLLITSTVVDYCCGRGIEANRDKPGRTRLMLLVSVFVNLGLLFTFKYFDFFAGTVDALCEAASLPYRVPQLGLILPVGISFYTFQTMSYTIDVYRGDYHAERNFITFALYVSYFPQLVAGPIETPGILLPQLQREQHLNWEDLRVGGRLLLCGFFRKCVVADYCGIFVNRVFNDGTGEANALAVAGAAALFCIQMYCDFAGYSLIAAGCARMMGVRLSRNFDQPYLSQSYSEFFRRWHITLNRWFTSYLYIPLGGSRKGQARKLLNTVIVFGLCGLWHGARWTYVLWGLYAAFFVCLESVLKKPASQAASALHLDLDDPMVKLCRRSLMFLIFLPAAILFRAGSVEQAFQMLATLFTAWGGGVQAGFDALGLNAVTLVQVALCIVSMCFLHTWEGYDPAPPATDRAAARETTASVYLVLTIALCWLALLASEDAAGFAYFQF